MTIQVLVGPEQQYEQDQSRLAEIGVLSTMIVHEARSPLTTIFMGLQSLLERNLSPADQQRLRLALDEAERLQRLLNELLLYSRSQSLAHSILDMNDLIQDVLALIRKIPAAHHKQLIFTPMEPPIVVLGDADKLKQVMINLLTNACEASPVGEQITCQLKRSEQNNGMHINIHNWGNPIPIDILPHITAPFFTTKPSGNGLGLAIVQRIIDDHDGQLHIASDCESGTQISVWLPTPPYGT